MKKYYQKDHKTFRCPHRFHPVSIPSTYSNGSPEQPRR